MYDLNKQSRAKKSYGRPSLYKPKKPPKTTVVPPGALRKGSGPYDLSATISRYRKIKEGK